MTSRKVRSQRTLSYAAIGLHMLFAIAAAALLSAMVNLSIADLLHELRDDPFEMIPFVTPLFIHTLCSLLLSLRPGPRVSIACALMSILFALVMLIWGLTLVLLFVMLLPAIVDLALFAAQRGTNRVRAL